MERNPGAVEFWAGAERRLNGLCRPAGANAKSLSHYTAISAGWLRHFGRRAPEPVDAGHAKWVHDEFESRISPQFGARRANGQKFATWLYFKEAPLTRVGIPAFRTVLCGHLGRGRVDDHPRHPLGSPSNVSSSTSWASSGRSDSGSTVTAASARGTRSGAASVPPNECPHEVAGPLSSAVHNCQSTGRNPHCEAIPRQAQTQLDNSGVEYEAFKVLAGASN
jgi:hypothetical protein